MNPDTAYIKLQEIYTEFKDFCSKRGQVSETDIRIKIIDRILKEVLEWPESVLVEKTQYMRDLLIMSY